MKRVPQLYPKYMKAVSKTEAVVTKEFWTTHHGLNPEKFEVGERIQTYYKTGLKPAYYGFSIHGYRPF